MIFVTVGMHHQGFERLIRAMDEVAAEISEDIIMQIGASSYEPQHTKSWLRFAEQKVIDNYCVEARVIVGHAGAGTVIGARHAKRPLVVSPRLASCNEHVNDHQVDLAEALAAQGKVIAVAPPSAPALITAIADAEKLSQGTTSNTQLVSALAAILNTAPARSKLFSLR